MTPNRIVAILTPLVFAPAAGAASAWLANHFPGVDIKPGDLQTVFVAGALIALAPAAQWLHGWQKYEARQAEADLAVEQANANAIAMEASQLDATGLDVENGAGLDDLDAGLGLLVGAD